MPRLYGELEAEDRMKVHTICYTGKGKGGVKVDEIIDGAGTLYVNPLTGEQWRGEKEEEPDTIDVIREKIKELSEILENADKKLKKEAKKAKKVK